MITRPSKNLVIASERGPAGFRPSNQANLLAALPTNPSVSDPRTVTDDMGPVQSGNGPGDNGLSSRGQIRRFVSNLTAARNRSSQIQRTGSPNASPVQYTTMSVDEATASMPNAPGTGKVMVSRIRRDNRTAWQINRFMQYGQPVFEAALVSSSPNGQDVLDQSEPLATETDAHNFIQAHEFQRTNVVPDTMNQQGFNRELFAKTFKRKDTAVNTSTNAMSRGSMMVPYVDSPAPLAPDNYASPGYSNLTAKEVERLELDGYVQSPAYQGSNGMGALDSKSMLLAALAVGGLYLLMRHR